MNKRGKVFSYLASFILTEYCDYAYFKLNYTPTTALLRLLATPRGTRIPYA